MVTRDHPDLGADDPVGIRVIALTASYGAEPVLRGIDLDVRGGEILALLGPSGCGKTTLLRCIAGLERPTSGTLMIGHRDVTAGRGVPAERRRVGMVFQDGALFPHRTVLDNVSYGIPRGPDRRDRALAALRRWGWTTRAVACRARCPAASSSGSPWPARWPPGRRSSCWTNRSPASTPPCGSSCATRCAGC